MLAVQLLTTTKTILVHCEHYHIEVNSGQNIRAEYFGRRIGSNVLSRIDLQIVVLTVDCDMIQECCAGTGLKIWV